MDADLHKMILQKAGSLLARRPYSRGELRNKLRILAVESQIESALDRLEQLNLLNDADYAYNFALCRTRQEGWGPAKIFETLLRRQVDPAIIESALERVRNELGDESIMVEYIRKRCAKRGMPADIRGVRNLVLHLRRRGFDEDRIFSALKQVIPSTLLERFDTGE